MLQGTNRRIALLADRELAAVVRICLRPLGVEILEALDARALPAAVAEADVDVAVIATKREPGIGLAALRALRADPTTADVSAILIAPRIDEAIVTRASGAGASEVIAIAQVPVMLAARVGFHLKKRQSEQDASLRLSRAERCGALGSWTWRGADRSMDWSRGLHRILGIAPATMSASHDGFLAAVHDEDRDLVARALAAALHSGRGWLLSHRVVRPDGEERVVRTEVEFRSEPPHLEGLMQDVTERTEAQRRIRELAHRDPLTSLPTRRLLVELLARAMKQADQDQSHVGVVFLDLDQFQHIGEILSRDRIEGILVVISERLVLALRTGDSVSRYGSDLAGVSRIDADEFVVVLPDVTGPEHAARVAARLRAAIAQPIHSHEDEIVITASAGVALYPDDGSEPERLIEQAAIAMRSSRGSGSVGSFTSDMRARAERDGRIEGALPGVIERQELWLAYQPQIAAATGLLVAAEALLRWTSPQLGSVRPDEFIGITERSGQIVTIGRFVLDSACREAALWGPLLDRPIALGVNVSARQLERLELVDEVREALATHAIAAESLQVEITETAFIRPHGVASETVRQLKRLGVRVSLDDFGTGYSALSHLARFEMDVVKIDQSFVRTVAEDSHQRAVVAAVIGLAHRLGAAVVAEGVETEAQERALREEGCDLLQGYRYARPLTPEDFRGLIARLGSTTPIPGWKRD